MTAQHIELGDILETPGHVHPRLYSIAGIHLGASGQESVVEIVPIDRSRPDAHGSRKPIFVPMEMIEAGIEAGIFNLTTA